MVLKFPQKEDHSMFSAFKAKSSFHWERRGAGFQTLVYQSPSPGLPRSEATMLISCMLLK